MAETQAQQPLHILISGAGIGGLTAAIALRQQGHHVEIYEQSRLAQETGAAIHLAPNCNGLLRRIGLIPEDIGANEFASLASYGAHGELKERRDFRPMNRMWQHPWQLVHRAHLHTALKEMAISPKGKGRPVNLHTASAVEAVDPEKATITLKNGSTVQGDLIIGADGVKSLARKRIPGGDLEPYDCGKSAYRFLIPTKDLASDPLTAEFVENPGDMLMWFGDDRRLVMYPCVRNELQNFVAIHPSEESGADVRGSGWHHTANKALMLEQFKQFGPNVKAVLEKVEESKINLWTLLDMDKMPTFVHGRLAVLGDAAHPFLPHQAQGGGQAIEDGISLAALLPLGTEVSEIPERLQLYNQQRYERSHKIQHFTRLAGEDLSKRGGKPLDMQEFTVYNVGHDEWHASAHALNKHLQSKQRGLRFRSPYGFGPSPGPRQPLGLSSASQAVHDIRKQTPEMSTTYSVKFRTSRTYLQNLLPPGFAFSSPATVAHASISCTSLDGMTWLGGKGYNFLGLYIHGVHYAKKGVSKVHGTFLAVLFENLTDPILTGREELGMPKLFADIDAQQTGQDCSIALSWRGAEFGRFEWKNLTKQQPAVNGTNGVPKQMGPPPPVEEGLLIHRYVPAVGEPGKTDADYAVLCPFPKPGDAAPQSESLVAESASLKFHAKDWQSLPTLHHIASALEEMPIYGIEEAKMAIGTKVDDLSTARRIQ